MPSSNRKYLVVGPAWVGDMVMAQSLFIDLKNRYQGCEIDVLAPQWTAALIDRMPQVSRLIANNFEHGKLSLAERWRMGVALRRNNYTHAIVLPNSLKAALIPAVARAQNRTGFLGEQRWGLLNDIRKLDKAKLPMSVQRFLALGREKGSPVVAPAELPAPSLITDLSIVSSTLVALGLSLQKPVLALCPGAEFGPSKKWPSSHYAQIAQTYLDKGWQVWLLGSDKDTAACRKINRELDQKAEVLAGLTSLPQAVDILSCASLVVSNDSGLMHIAAGLNRPLVAVYGSTDPSHTPPLNSNHRVAKIDLECAPCFKRECPLTHHNCMRLLEAELVLEKATELLG